MERLASVSRVTFDKTGTLTYGTPEVTEAESFLPELSKEELYAYAAGAELRSEHPLGKAVIRFYRKSGREIPEAEQFEMLPGRGVSAVISGKKILAGNLYVYLLKAVFLKDQEKKQAEECTKRGCTIMYLAVDGQAAGFIALSDTLRPEAPDMIGELKAAGVTPVLLTGDHGNAAGETAARLSIEEVHADCRPEDKLNYIDQCQKEKKNVCMIGDGINDAPALKKAWVGIAMGGTGSDIAVDAADIALVNDEIRELPHLVRLSKRMMRTIRYNLTFSMTLNFIAIILAITGVLNPVVGALVHNAGSVFVILNSAFLLTWRRK